MILSFKMKGNGFYDHIDAMIHKKIPWIRSVLDLTGVGGGGVGGVQSPKPKSDIQSPKCASLSKGGRTTSSSRII